MKKLWSVLNLLACCVIVVGVIYFYLQSPSLSQPLSIQAQLLDNDQVKVSWSGVSLAEKYELEISGYARSSVFTSTVERNYAFIVGLYPDTAYTIRVRAVSGHCSGDFSIPLQFSFQS